MTATYQCRFYIFMEWFDPNAVGLPPGDVSEENRKKLWVPEIALQNTLKTGVEIHYPPEVIFSEKGHVAAKVLYQARVAYGWRGGSGWVPRPSCRWRSTCDSSPSTRSG